MHKIIFLFIHLGAILQMLMINYVGNLEDFVTADIDTISFIYLATILQMLMINYVGNLEDFVTGGLSTFTSQDLTICG
jgi:hypothetical protein